MTYEIEKNVPVTQGTQGAPIYPFREMQPGDSIFVPEEKVVSARRAASAWGQRQSVKMATRMVPGGVRIWRLS